MNRPYNTNQATQDVAPWVNIDFAQVQLPDITWREFFFWIFRLRRRVRVTGSSMLPLLKPNDEVLVDIKAYQQAKPKVGDVVVAKHPEKHNLEIIKRITEVFQNDRYFLKGDNPAFSTDSRSFGAIDLASLKGRVTCRFA